MTVPSQWYLKESERLCGPYTESEIRTRLIARDFVNGAIVRQGESPWRDAEEVRRLFEQLSIKGWYVQVDTRIAGPFLPERLLALHAANRFPTGAMARRGQQGDWHPLATVLSQLQQWVAAGQADFTHPPSSTPPAAQSDFRYPPSSTRPAAQSDYRYPPSSTPPATQPDFRYPPSSTPLVTPRSENSSPSKVAEERTLDRSDKSLQDSHTSRQGNHPVFIWGFITSAVVWLAGFAVWAWCAIQVDHAEHVAASLLADVTLDSSELKRRSNATDLELAKAMYALRRALAHPLIAESQEARSVLRDLEARSQKAVAATPSGSDEETAPSASVAGDRPDTKVVNHNAATELDTEGRLTANTAVHGPAHGHDGQPAAPMQDNVLAMSQALHESRSIKSHQGAVLAIAFSPDGKSLISGGEDRKLRLLSVDSATELHEFTGHLGEVKCVAFLPDGRRAATGSADRSVRIWDVHAKSEIHRLTGPEQAVNSLAVSPDGSLVAAQAADGLFIWQSDTGQLVLRKTFSTRAYGVAFSMDGKRLCFGNWLMDVSPFKQTRLLSSQDFIASNCRFTAHPDFVISRVAYTKDGLVELFNRSESRQTQSLLRVWRCSTGTPMQDASGHYDKLVDVAATPEARWFATSSHDRTVRIWDWEADRLREKYRFDVKSVPTALALSAVASQVAWGDADGTVRLIPVPRFPAPMIRRSRHDGQGMITETHLPTGNVQLAFDAYGESIIALDRAHGVMRRLERPTLQETATVRFPHTPSGQDGFESFLDPSGQSAILSYLQRYNHRRTWHLDIDSQKWTELDWNDSQKFLGFSPDGHHIALLTEDGVSVLDLRLNKVIRSASPTVPSPDGRTVAATEVGSAWRFLQTCFPEQGTAALTADDAVLVGFGRDHELRTMDMTSGLVRRLVDFPGTTMRLSRNGKLGVTAIVLGESSTHSLIVWNAEDWKAVQRIDMGSHKTTHLAFPREPFAISPDGELVAGVAVDRRSVVGVWSSRSGQKIAESTGHRQTVVSLAFAPASDRIASIDESGRLLVWDIPAPKDTNAASTNSGHDADDRNEFP